MSVELAADWATIIAAVITIVRAVPRLRGRPQTSNVRQDTHASQSPNMKPWNVNASAIARAWRFVRSNPSSVGTSIVWIAYLAWVALRPGPVGGVTVVAVALAAADLHATVLLWILGGSDRTLGRILDGDRPFGEDVPPAP